VGHRWDNVISVGYYRVRLGEGILMTDTETMMGIYAHEMAIKGNRPILGGLYFVSPDGRFFVGREQYKNTKTGKELKTRITRKGYAAVSVTKDRKCFSRHVHFFVAHAFLGPRPDGMQVNHKDGVKTNNHYSNLEYVTPQQNHAHAVINGLHAKGETAGVAKLTAVEIIAIRKMYRKRQKGFHGNSKQVALKFGICPSTVIKIAKYKAWRHVV
jgi:hypothetical protein